MSSKSNGKNKPRLGRGLSSLISVSEMAEAVEGAGPAAASAVAEAPASTPLPAVVEAPRGIPLEVAIDHIAPNPHQPRRHFDDAKLAELAASIRSTGLIQPVVVRQVGGGYQLVSGERRLRAARLAGLATVPVIVKEIDAVTQAQMALIENIQREDLNPIERAQGYRTLIEQLGLTQVELAARLGEDRSSIANFIRLLDLAEPVRAMVRDGRLSAGHAKLIAGVADVLEQERLANLVVLQGLSVRNLERVMKEPAKTPLPKPDNAASAHLVDLEKTITRQLGLRVQVRTGARKGRGKLVIHYASLDQFDELLQRLNVQTDHA